MGEKKITITKTVEGKQVAAFLRLLAAELEGKGNPELNEFGIQLHDFNKLKMGLIKQEGGQLSLHLKIKNYGQETPGTNPESIDIAEHEYRLFKRHMKSTFVELTHCAEQGALPSPKLLALFLSQSTELISFPGFGDPYYDDYTQACSAMKQAVEEGSTAAFQEKLTAISALKKACHQRFK